MTTGSRYSISIARLVCRVGAEGEGRRDARLAASRRTPQHILAKHASRARTTRVCIYVGHMVVSTGGALGPHERPTSAQGLAVPSSVPRPHPLARESPHEFSMRLAAHLCRDRPHRHHRPWTKLVNLLTAPHVLHGGRRATALRRAALSLSLPPFFLGRVRSVYAVCTRTCRTNSSSRFYRPTESTRCATVMENTGFSATLARRTAVRSRLSSCRPCF